MIAEIIQLSFYCHCAICCGKEGGLTSAGTIPRQERTIAAPKKFPLGTKVFITCHKFGWNRKVFIVEDRMSDRAAFGNRIDVFYGPAAWHEKAKRSGLEWATIEYQLPSPGRNGTKTSHDSRSKSKRLRGLVVEPKPPKTSKGVHASPGSDRRRKEAVHPGPRRKRSVRRGPRARSVHSHSKTQSI